MSAQNKFNFILFTSFAILVYCLNLNNAIEDKISSLFSTPNLSGNKKPSKIVCYWGSWSFYRQGQGKFEAENTDAKLCTHLIYAFAKLNADNKIAAHDLNLDIGSQDSSNGEPWGHGMYKKFVKLKKSNPKLKIMLAIGGWGEGSDKYSQMASNANSRQIFVRSVSEFLKKYGFDGIDIDWEYPGYSASGDGDRTQGSTADKANFVLLLRDLKTELSKSKYLLSIAATADKEKIDHGCNVKEINKYVDFINVMTYDFHGGWDPKTGHNAPLFPTPGDTEKNKQFTVQYAIDYWLSSGANPNKLIMGIPLYGRTFTLKSQNEKGIGASATGSGGTAGPISNQIGYLTFSEICQRITEKGYQVYFNDKQKIKYAVKDDQWIGLDDVETINHKLAYLFSKKLGGAMIWSLDLDDFGGNCAGTKYPLLKAINHYGGKLIKASTILKPKVTPKPSINKVSKKPDKASCKPLWDNHCKVNSECCTKFCERPADWEYGVCKNK